MKKIIDGKKYNTETAKLIGDYWNGESGFNEEIEELYLKKTGEFFLYVQGGAASRYGTYCGNNQWGDSRNIIPYSIAEAQEWAMNNMSCDAYEALFGEVEE